MYIMIELHYGELTVRKKPAVKIIHEALTYLKNQMALSRQKLEKNIS